MLLDEDLRGRRTRFCRVMSSLLVNVEDWLAVDSWLGGGRVYLAGSEEEFGADFEEFRAVATLVCMTSELAEAAVEMVERRRYYAVAATIRQLIECEYLAALFTKDWEAAKRWWESTPAQIRRSFSPAGTRRVLGKFSNQEYWKHCDAGGHPAPSGARFLVKMDISGSRWNLSASELEADLGLHLRRCWSAIDELLLGHHPRYENVRSSERHMAESAWAEWQEQDVFIQLIVAGFTVADETP